MDVLSGLKAIYVESIQLQQHGPNVQTLGGMFFETTATHTLRNDLHVHKHTDAQAPQGKTTSASGHTVQAATPNVSTDRRLPS